MLGGTRCEGRGDGPAGKRGVMLWKSLLAPFLCSRKGEVTRRYGQWKERRLQGSSKVEANDGANDD